MSTIITIAITLSIISIIVSSISIINSIKVLTENKTTERDIADFIIDEMKMGCTVEVKCYKHIIDVDGKRFHVSGFYWDRIHDILDASKDARIANRRCFNDDGNVMYALGRKGYEF